MDKPQRRGVDRRRLMSLGGTAIAASSLATTGRAAETASGQQASRQVTITEGTNIAVSASPDGKVLAFDLFGVIWTLPIGGGAAKRLTDNLTDGAQPDWSPDGKRLVFQSYRDGTFQIWTVGADGAGDVGPVFAEVGVFDPVEHTDDEIGGQDGHCDAG